LIIRLTDATSFGIVTNFVREYKLEGVEINVAGFNMIFDNVKRFLFEITSTKTFRIDSDASYPLICDKTFLHLVSRSESVNIVNSRTSITSYGLTRIFDRWNCTDG
ncbi:hypothetical protein PMAYCL1PPCAC_04649, partial [Pristionchus mayeri]